MFYRFSSPGEFAVSYLDIFHFTFDQGENSDVKHYFSYLGYLTVFTFTPSWGVCLVVRLYPSIFCASSPTTAGLWEGEKSRLNANSNVLHSGTHHLVN